MNPKTILALAGIALGGALIADEAPLREVPFSFDPNFKRQVVPRHDYSKTLVGKLFLCQAEFERPFKRRDNGKQTVRMTCEQAVEALRGMDAITLGMPKVIYLVGWQYNGHDSKYPAFFEGNAAVKRACDADPLDSVRWVMAEGRKCHTAVSLHVNMFDAYEDSPLFDEYVRNDVLARDKDGKLLLGEWGYKVCYPAEWAKGLAQKRLDRLLEILPIREAGTLQIDAFHSAAPIGYIDEQGRQRVRFQSPISPYHKYTRQDDIDAQKKIIKYLEAKGVDVTEEGNVQCADGQLAGSYVPLIYHYGAGNFFRYPRNVLSYVNCGDPWSRVFGRNPNVEVIFVQEGVTPAGFRRFRSEFCRTTLVANYLNRFTPQKAQEGGDVRRVAYDRGLVAELRGGRFSLVQDGVALAEDDDILIPAEWTAEKDLVAYSEKGYGKRTWRLPAGFPASGTAKVSEIDERGPHALAPIAFADGRLTLALKPGQMLRLEF